MLKMSSGITGHKVLKTREVVRKYGWRCDVSVEIDAKLKQMSSSKKIASGTVAGSIRPDSTFSDVSVGQTSTDEGPVTPTHVSQERF